jgi:hypothetical protein
MLPLEGLLSAVIKGLLIVTARLMPAKVFNAPLYGCSGI